jgi:zinc protease
MAKENNEIPPTSHQPLPAWAQRVLEHLRPPQQTLSPADLRLTNGIRLIVQSERISHTVVVAGQIRNDPAVQEPAGKEGVADVAEGLFPYGTTTYDRLAFQRQLDEIAATTSGGTDFGLEVLSSNFERGVALLADQELHPAFNPADFAIVRDQLAGELVGRSARRNFSHKSRWTARSIRRAIHPSGARLHKACEA